MPIQVAPYHLDFPPSPPDPQNWQARLAAALAHRNRIWLVRYLPAAFGSEADSVTWFAQRGFGQVSRREDGGVVLLTLVREGTLAGRGPNSGDRDASPERTVLLDPQK